MVLFFIPHGFFSPRTRLALEPFRMAWHFRWQADHSKDDGTTLAAIRKMITESDDPDGDG